MRLILRRQTLLTIDSCSFPLSAGSSTLRAHLESLKLTAHLPERDHFCSLLCWVHLSVSVRLSTVCLSDWLSLSVSLLGPSVYLCPYLYRLSVRPSVCPSVRPSFFLLGPSVCLSTVSICLSLYWVHMSVSVRPSTVSNCLSVFLFPSLYWVHPSVSLLCPSVCLSTVCLFVCLSLSVPLLCPSVCLSTVSICLSLSVSVRLLGPSVCLSTGSIRLSLSVYLLGP